MESSYELSEEDIQACGTQLKDFFPTFLEISTQELRSYGISQNVLVYYSYAIQYNLQGGRLLRGTLVLATVKALAGNNVGEHLLTQTLIVAWCVELLQTSFLVADDIMDQSTKRRSNTCWYLVPTIGVANAINDTMFLYTLIYRILFKTMRDSKNFVAILEAFNRVSMTTILGQHMDTYDSRNDSLFDQPEEAVKLYEEICKNKTAYYSFFLPIKLGASVFTAGMLLSDLETSNLMYAKVESLAVLLGSLFQAHDDYTDCYGDPQKSGKTGTDIQTKKCSWLLTQVGRLSAQALTLASDDQRASLKENLGHYDNAKVEAVRRVYDDLDLVGTFRTYAEHLEGEINRYDFIKLRLGRSIRWKTRVGNIKQAGVKGVLKWCLAVIRGRMRD